MNDLVRLYLENERERLLSKALRREAKEIRRLQKEIEPLRAKVQQRRKERMRQDGPRGFKMAPDA